MGSLDPLYLSTFYAYLRNVIEEIRKVWMSGRDSCAWGVGNPGSDPFEAITFGLSVPLEYGSYRYIPRSPCIATGALWEQPF